MIESEIAMDSHLDDDTMAAFVESRLSEAEVTPVIAHLVACSSCRHTTAQLVRLESDMADVPEQVGSTGPLRSFFDGVTAGLTTPEGEDAVFAYQNPEGTPEDVRETPPVTDEEEPKS